MTQETNSALSLLEAELQKLITSGDIAAARRFIAREVPAIERQHVTYRHMGDLDVFEDFE